MGERDIKEWGERQGRASYTYIYKQKTTKANETMYNNQSTY